MTTNANHDSDQQPAGADEIQGKVNTYWNIRSATYGQEQSLHSDYGEREVAVWLAILRDLLPPPPADVLDVGTGTGFLALLMAQLGHRVTGVDLSEGMLAVARGKSAGAANPPRFEVGDAHAPPFPPGSFNVVASRHVLWTLREPEAAFAHWYRLLRPGGRVVAFDSPWYPSDSYQEPDPQHSWQPAWAALYSGQVRAGLPLMGIAALDPVLPLLTAVGFADVRLERLGRLEQVERALFEDVGTTPQVTERYVITASRPG